MPDIDSLQWISGEELLQLWPLDAFEIAMALARGELVAYDPVYSEPVVGESNFKMLLKNNNENRTHSLISRYKFQLSEVIKFESKYLANQRRKEDVREDNNQLEIYAPFKKIIKAIEEIGCEHCAAKLVAKRELINFKKQEIKGNDKRELGRLKREKKKWDLSIKAALEVGLLCNQSEEPLKRADLRDFLYNKNFDLPDTTIEKIWKAIPEKLKKSAGRPPLKKN
jgi:hypothetical protein